MTAHIADYYRHIAAQMTYEMARWNYLDKAARYQLRANKSK
jgi:hypothetical protein